MSQNYLLCEYEKFTRKMEKKRKRNRIIAFILFIIVCAILYFAFIF